MIAPLRLTALTWLLASLAWSQPAWSQQDAKKATTLRGTVEQVNQDAKRVRIANEPVEGGMGAMTMTYGVDQDAVLANLKPGDRITAKVYDGDMTLYEVTVQPAAVPAGAGTSGGMQLEDLERIALANNPAIALAEANVRVSAGLARQAGLYPNPTVGYYGDEIRGGYTGGGKQGGFVSQTILLGGKLRAARHVADLMTNESKTTSEMQRLRVVNSVRMSFYNVLAAQRLLEVRQTLAKVAEDAAQTAHQLANIGQTDRPDVLRAELEQQQAIVSLRVAQHNLEGSWRILAAVIGKPDLPAARLEGALDAIPDLNYEQSLAITLRESPEVRLAMQTIERNEASLTQARKAPIPDLQLYGNLAQNNEPLETTHRGIGLNGGVQIGVQLPLFNRNQGNIAAARAQIESARQELARVRIRVARDLAGLFRDYDSARETALQYKTEMLPRAEQGYQLHRASYQSMAAAYPQALVSQRMLYQLQAEYVHALQMAWQSSLAIRGFGLVDGPSMATQ